LPIQLGLAGPVVRHGNSSASHPAPATPRRCCGWSP